MTLDPVHLEGIAELARQIRHETAGTDHRARARDVWEGYLDPLYGDDGPLLEPLGELARYRAPVDEVGLQPPAFDAVHGLDSGTVNPRTFANGLVLDVAQAAASATPSEMELHRARTIVACIHSNDATVDAGDDWESFDDGDSRRRVVQVPKLPRDRDRAVHGLALGLAESAHALAHADEVPEFLLLDGPLYPPSVVDVAIREGDAGAALADHDLGREVCHNYARLVERFVERDVPVAGFVKNTESTALLRAIDDRDRAPPTPWADDRAFFARVLEPESSDVLTWTNWFRSRLGTDDAFARSTAPPGVDRALDREAYEVAFFVCHDPRTELTFRVELPAAFADDPDVRERVQQSVLRGVAAESGPPTPVRKADALARIDRGEKASLVDRVEAALDTPRARSYDDERWGLQS